MCNCTCINTTSYFITVIALSTEFEDCNLGELPSMGTPKHQDYGLPPATLVYKLERLWARGD